MDVGSLKKSLCETFCAEVSINPVPVGWAISGLFEDNSGDRISFYMTETPDGIAFEDDGDFLAEMIASRIDIENGQRSELLNSVLASADAYWDKDTYQIKSNHAYDQNNLSIAAIKFLSALVRARDIALLTRDVIRSTFREDVAQALEDQFGGKLTISENQAIDPRFKDFAADFVLTNPANSKTGALYLVNSTEKLLEAQLLLMELVSHQSDDDYPVIAMIEDLNKVSTNKFKRAQNSGLQMPIYTGDEFLAVERVGKIMGVQQSAQIH
ncbi:DUF1828 domain-containing protein [Terasakiella sp. A23]|uniref:DUF1828 domain-containing protein n=1 Tax=Terasakiella sp. FCG-A23 TaxID=3080561 RepID=UPI002952BCF8|nr:DUF1828 domain-containing protein [Terasakiella sp. A23]MDV7341579.1 DUF1828 domain-containing protein [Terasakiella sp. A23]